MQVFYFRYNSSIHSYPQPNSKR